jgi:aspartate/methionine/tyrosine aminotransferase
MFSNRVASLDENELWRALSRKRAAGDAILDLTASNPTREGWAYPGDAILDALATAEALTYEPSPRGLLVARRAVSGYYRGHHRDVGPDDIFLTASTSEAYSFSFKLLCDAGDRVLVPRPSYPIFDALATLEAVEPIPYALEHGPQDPLPPRCRAILAVHPNNPTGTYVTEEVRRRLVALSDDHDIALIVDEVFLDYPFSGHAPPSFAGGDRGLVFTLSGLSKVAALPQMKLGWIALGGARARVDAASARLEHIADAFLSVGTPVQLAAPRLLDLAPEIRGPIRARLERNLAALERAAGRVPEVSCPVPDGGWYGSLRLPAIASSESWALDCLERASVYLHPGELFGFEREARVVVSLLPPPERFDEAIDRILAVVSDRVHSTRA